MYVIKQKEDSSDKVVWEGNPEGFIRSITSNKKNKSPLLRGIALYEDTYFNSQQTKDLVNELNNIKEKISDQKEKKELESLITFAQTVDIQEHLVFIGD